VDGLGAAAGARLGATDGDRVTNGDGVTDGDRVTGGDGVTVALASGAGFADTYATGLRVSRGFGDAAGDAVDRNGVGDAIAVSATTAAGGVGVCTTTVGARLGTGAGEWRVTNAESNAPMPSPAMMTPANKGTIGSPPRSPSSLEGRRRRGPRSELMSASVPRQGNVT